MQKIIFTIFIFLAHTGISASVKCENTQEQLQKAVEKEDIGAVRNLLAASKILKVKHLGLIAASKGSLEILEALFQYDPELLWNDGVEIKNGFSGDTAVMLAVKANSRDAVHYLIEKDANYETPNPENQSPLIVAIMEEKVGIAIELLKNAANTEFSLIPYRILRFETYHGLTLSSLAWHFSSLWDERVVDFLKELQRMQPSALEEVYRTVCNGLHPRNDRREVRRLLLKYHPDKTGHKSSIKFQKIMSLLDWV